MIEEMSFDAGKGKKCIKLVYQLALIWAGDKNAVLSEKRLIAAQTLLIINIIPATRFVAAIETSTNK